MTSSCHRCLGHPNGLVPIGFQANSFLVGLAWSILWICPSHLILCALMNLTISATSINSSISCYFIFSIYCQYWQDQISSLVFAFQKCVGNFHLLRYSNHMGHNHILSRSYILWPNLVVVRMLPCLKLNYLLCFIFLCHLITVLSNCIGMCY